MWLPDTVSAVSSMIMETAKRQRKEQLRRYYVREHKRRGEERNKQSLTVVTIKDNARLRDAAIKNSVEESKFISV